MELKRGDKIRLKKIDKGLSLIPLGGIGEIGKNMLVFEYDTHKPTYDIKSIPFRPKF